MNNCPRFLRFSIHDQISLVKRLGMILRSGTSVLSALTMLENEAGTKSSKYLLSKITTNVSRGKTLTQAFESCDNIFNPFCITMIHIGERSGTLAEHLLYLADELKKRDLLTKRVIGALIYPAIIVLATIGISLVLTVYIFPKIVPIFQGFREQLPFSTRVLMNTSHFLSHEWMWLLCGIVVVGIAGYFLQKIGRVRVFYDHILIRLPLIGPLIRLYNIILISRTLGLLLRSGASFVESSELTIQGVQHTLYCTELKSAELIVKKGKPFSAHLSQFTLLFPSLFVQMIRAGEHTGDLSGSLLYLSEMYEEELNERIKNMTTLIEPVLMVVMGITVGFIAMSIITPIYAITQNLNHYK